VRLLSSLASNLREWRLASGRPPDDQPVFPGARGGPWTADGWNRWRDPAPKKKRDGTWAERGGWPKALAAAGIDRARPYDLRHSFASLLLHEGRSVIDAARQLGHRADLTMRTYGHVIEELEDAPGVPAEDAIRAARDELVPLSYLDREAT
jgi:integrase